MMTKHLRAKYRHWEKQLSDWEASGETGVAYCRRQEIPVWKFRYWKRKLRPANDEQESQPSKPDNDFVEVSFAPPEQTDRFTGLRFELASGVRLILEKGFDSTELVRVLEVVGA